MKIARILITLIVFGILVTSACKAQPEEEEEVPGIHGIVTDLNGMPLEELPVILSNRSFGKLDEYRTFTDPEGRYDFGAVDLDLDSGKYELTIRWVLVRDLSCPTYEQGISMLPIDGFVAGIETSGFYKDTFVAVKLVDFKWGTSTGIDLEIPCTGTSNTPVTTETSP